MIYSLTIAPAMDYSLDLGTKELKVGCTNRLNCEGFSLGGKGITVARMLNNLKVKNIPIVACGGSMGKQMKEIKYYTTGEFMKLTHVTKKTLRYYNEHDILKPAMVTEPEGGVCFFSEEGRPMQDRAFFEKYRELAQKAESIMSSIRYK